MFVRKDLLRFALLLMMLFVFLVPTRVSATQFVDVEKLNEEGAFDFSTTPNTAANQTSDMKFGGIQENEDFWNIIYSRYSSIITLISGALSLFFVGVFIVNITKYGASASNPQARKQSMVTLLWTGGAAALFGGVTLWVGLFYNFVG